MTLLSCPVSYVMQRRRPTFVSGYRRRSCLNTIHVPFAGTLDTQRLVAIGRATTLRLPAVYATVGNTLPLTALLALELHSVSCVGSVAILPPAAMVSPIDGWM